ncbi:MAG: penicillin-binding protein 1A [Alphaproteobacteria bacterium]|nr:penicillin-binding protein 1A [Alphaproteobacteria bacterium]
MRYLNNILGVGVTLFIVGMMVIVLLLWQLSRGLPDYTHLANYTPPVMSRVHAGNGTLIAEYAKQRRLFVPIQTVPRRVINAFLASEDKNFYDHIGIDVVGIIRAAIQNVINVATGKRLEGASTITQQVAKNFLLSSDVTIERKIKEAILSLRLERTFTKDQILELYLNEIYLGFGSYGVAAASLNYFSKPLNELTIAEAAYLAALPKAPNNYHPFRYRARALSRRNWVVARMLENEFINETQAQTAQAADLIITRRPVGVHDTTTGHFVETVRRQIYDIYGQSQLYGGGLSIRTTLNTDLQDIALQSLRDGLEAYDRRGGYRGAVAKLASLDDWHTQLGLAIKRIVPDDIKHRFLAVVLEVDRAKATIGLHHTPEVAIIALDDMKWARTNAVSKRLSVGDIIWVAPRPSKRAASKKKPPHYLLRQLPEVNGAIVAMDPHTGRVLAMVGGYSYKASEFNRALQAKRQPGSAFKPFVYAAALDSGFAPTSLVLDAPFVIEQGNEQGLWKPENFGRKFYGLSTLRRGVEQSRNLMTVRMAQEIGMNKIVRYAKRFNIVDSMPPVLAMSLGAGETQLMRLSAAYAMFVNGGKRIEPVFIDRIQDRYGKTLYRNDTRPCIGCASDVWAGQAPPTLPDIRAQVLSPQTAYQMVSILEGVVKRGTGRRVSSLNKTLAGKTGTTNDNRDAWFVGFSPDLVVGVFVGYDDGRPLGKNNTGSRVAAPIFRQFMRDALRGVHTAPFRIPPEISLVRVNANTGKLATPDDDAKHVILEAFKRGTEPTRTQTQRVINTQAAPSANTPKRREAAPILGSGTGGVY